MHKREKKIYTLKKDIYIKMDIKMLELVQRRMSKVHNRLGIRQDLNT